VKRGEIWTISGAGDYGGKPRPSVIVQDEIFHTRESVTVCGFTSDPTLSELMRIRVPPTRENGLLVESSIMVDKITTVPRTKLGRRIGELSQEQMAALSRAIIVFLGLVKGSRENR
jgi:mRNA interferase MazF